MTVSAGFTAPLEGKTLASTPGQACGIIDYFVFQDADEAASLQRAFAEFLS